MSEEAEKLKERFEKMGIKQFHVDWAEDAEKLTLDERVATINEMLDVIESGNTKEIFDFEHFLEFDSQKQCDEFYTLFPGPDYYRYLDDMYTFNKLMDIYEKILPDLHKMFMKQYKDY